MFRSLWKNKTFSFLNIFGLAIGIACAGLIFLWVEDETSFDNINAKKDRLYQLQVNMSVGGQSFTMGSTPRPMAAALQSEIAGIAHAARYSDNEERRLFTFQDKSIYLSGRYTDPTLFNMFTFDFVEGNANAPFPQFYSVVLTESSARKIFGDNGQAVGKIVKINNRHEYAVSGVIRDLPENSTLQFDWLAPYQRMIAPGEDTTARQGDATNWGSFGPYTYVELDQSANPSAINSQLKDFISNKSSDRKTETFLFPMKDWRLYSEFANGKPTGGGRIQQVHMLSALAWIILLIACINFMNLATATSQQRAREVGVRKVLGSGKARLIRRFMGEAFFISFLATGVAVVIMLFSLPGFNMLMQKRLTLGMGNPVHIQALLTITLLCGLVAGSYPSLYLSSFNPILVLKSIRIRAGSAPWIRKGLVVFQFAVSVIFIFGTLIVYMQIQHLKDRDLGFNRANLVQINPQHDISNILPLIKSELLASGLIENAAIADHPTLKGGNSDHRFEWEGKSPDNQVSIAVRNVSPGYIATSGMKIMEGRDFRAEEDSGNADVIINQAMAKLMGLENPVGRILQSPRGNPDGVFSNRTVVGVVNDYVYGNAYGQANPLVLFCRKPDDETYLYIRTKAGSNPGQALAATEAVMKKANPSYPFEYKFVDEEFNKMFRNETLISKISGVFAALAIIISCLGLFGLAAFTAEQRTKEIGIRKVLGATVGGITGLLVKDFLQFVLIACLIAFPLAWWIMHSWLQNYQYRIGIPLWAFFVVGAAGIFLSLATIGFQAIKAAMANPVRSLRAE